MPTNQGIPTQTHPNYIAYNQDLAGMPAPDSGTLNVGRIVAPTDSGAANEPRVVWAPGQSATVGDESSIRMPLYVVGAADFMIARAWALCWCPQEIFPTISNNQVVYYLNEVGVTERRNALGVWDGEAIYKTIRPEDNQWMTADWDTSAETGHITQSLNLTHTLNVNKWHAPGENPTDPGGAIGATVNEVEGTDIYVPKLEWTEHWRLPSSWGEFNQFYNLSLITGTINYQPFRGFDPLSVLFMGATGSWSKKSSVWSDIVFHFKLGQGRTYPALGPFVNVVKGPWQYLWFLYRNQPTIDADGDPESTYTASRKALACFAEDVYYPGDWNYLGIPLNSMPARNSLPPLNLVDL